MMRVRVQTDHDRLGEEIRDGRVIGAPVSDPAAFCRGLKTRRVGDRRSGDGIETAGLENLLVDADVFVLRKAPDGFCRAQDGVADVGVIETDEGAVAFLDLDDAVFDSHSGTELTGTAGINNADVSGEFCRLAPG